DAQAELAERYGIGVDLLSAPSFKAAREEALEAERWNRLHPGAPPRVPMVTQRLAEGRGPVVAVTDYMAMVPDQIARWVPRRFFPLGTDGFGRSDTRESLRRFFETDANSVVSAVLSALAAEGSLDPAVAADAVARYDLNRPHFDPTG
ncbi:MAG: pyruvate dehydrogenase (acetyl-transferring), homodimeric type, partial [bacterium]|nr:pyruvate dehydrogenase (acetyl-transferring), homodimeric type [bacterium]